MTTIEQNQHLSTASLPQSKIERNSILHSWSITTWPWSWHKPFSSPWHDHHHSWCNVYHSNCHQNKSTRIYHQILWEFLISTRGTSFIYPILNHGPLTFQPNQVNQVNQIWTTQIALPPNTSRSYMVHLLPPCPRFEAAALRPSSPGSKRRRRAMAMEGC